MGKKWLSALGPLVLVLIVGGCATKYPPASPDFAQGVESQYLIGPGDMANIIVWRNPELSMIVPVRPDGKITAPLVEDLPVSGKTPTAVARDIEKYLEKYIQSPVVTVVVTQFVGPYSQQIRVIGEAAKPQALPYRENMSLLDVMIGGGKSEQFGVRLWDLIRKGDLSANVVMRPGDVLVIPQSFF